MVWVIGTITLSPSDPYQVIDDNPTENENYPIGSGLPVNIASGLGVRSLRLIGELWKDGYLLTDLAGSLDTLGSYNKGTVAITGSMGRFSGTWRMTNFNCSVLAEGGQAKVGYSMEFKQGGSYLTL